MADERINDYTGQYQKRLIERFQKDPIGKRPLMAMANKSVIPTGKGANEYRVYTKPFVRGNRSTLDAVRAKTTGNFLTSDPTKGGQIASKSLGLKYEDFKIEDTFDFGNEVDLTLGIDNPVNSVENQTKIAKEVHDGALSLHVHELLLEQAILSDEWISDAPDLTLTDAITAGATTFKVSNADKAYIAEEMFVKIGNKRMANAVVGLVENVDVVMVASGGVGADDTGGSGKSLITIETDTGNFPAGYHFDGAGEIFTRLVTSLAAHDANTRIQVDKPIAITSENVDEKVIRKIRTKAIRSYIDPKRLTNYLPPEVTDIMSSEKTPFVQNDFLGKGILTDGRTGTLRGIASVEEPDAVSRTLSDGTVIHYVWTFQRNESFCYKEFLDSRAVGEKMQGRANTLIKDTYFYVGGAHTPRNGAIRMLLTAVKIG